MAHSWTGNTVTCADWTNLWLNEGFTVFAQRKVSQQIKDVDFTKVSAFIGNQSAYNDMLNFGYFNSYSSLHPSIKGDNPDNSFSEVPYEKGYQFLNYIESLIGESNMKLMLNEFIVENTFHFSQYVHSF